MSDDKKDHENEELEDFESFEEDFEDEFDEGAITEDDPFSEEDFDEQGAEPDALSEEDYEDEWDDNVDEFGDEEEGEFAVQDKKKFPISANAMIMAGGALVAVAALVFTVMSSSEKATTVRVEDPPARGVPMQGKHSMVYGKSERGDEQPKEEEENVGLFGNSTELSDIQGRAPARTQAPTVIEDAPQMPSAFNNPVNNAPVEQRQGVENQALQEQDARPEGGQPLLPLPDQEEVSRQAVNSGSDTGLASILPQEMGQASTEEAAARPPENQGRSGAAPSSAPSRESSKHTQTQQDTSAPQLQAGMNAEISSRLSEILNRLDTLEEKVTETSRNAATENEMRSLQKTVSALEKKVDRLGNSPRSSASGAAARGAANTERSKPVAAPAPREVVRKPAPKWELRAAQPGRAWIALSGSSEMRQVDVGDSVEGLGRITEISYKNGIWVINGTQGKVSQ